MNESKFEEGGLYRYQPVGSKTRLRFITLDKSDPKKNPYGKCVPGNFFKPNELVVVIHVTKKEVWAMTSSDIGILVSGLRMHFKQVRA